MSALDDLFPPAIRKTRGKVIKHKKEKNSASFLRTLTSKQKAWGAIKRIPEVYVHFGKADVKSFVHICKAADYISRNGKLILEDQDGAVYSSKNEYRPVLEYWQQKQSIPEYTDRYAHARRIILSMPKGTDEKKFELACREWAKNSLQNYDWLMAFHTESSDKRTHQPHCHILLRTKGKDGTRIHLNNEERDVLREYFAVCLRNRGIQANATKRISRGKTQKSLIQSEYNNLKRFKNNKDRAKAYAIAKKKTLLTQNLSTRVEEIKEAVYSNTNIPDHEAIRFLKKKRTEQIQTAIRAEKELRMSDNPSDHILGKEIRKFVENFGPVESLQQKTLREVHQRQAEQIRRMQAMKRRKRDATNNCR